MKKNELISKLKKYLLPAGAVLAVFVTILTVNMKKTAPTGSEVQSSVLEKDSSGNVSINISDISETASFLNYDAQGTTIQLFAVKASDGSIRTALNTCQVCAGSPRAYFEQNNDVFVCQNCGNPFSTDQIGIERGGCNPIPLTDDLREVTDDRIVFSTEILDQAGPIFNNWKKF